MKPVKEGLKIYGLAPVKPYVQEVVKAKVEQKIDESEKPVQDEREAKEAMKILDKTEEGDDKIGENMNLA